jgi:hypothetical protein
MEVWGSLEASSWARCELRCFLTAAAAAATGLRCFSTAAAMTLCLATDAQASVVCFRPELYYCGQINQHFNSVRRPGSSLMRPAATCLQSYIII